MGEPDLAKIQHMLGRGEQAAASEALRETLKAHPDNVQVLHLAAIAAMQGGDMAQAVGFYQRAIAADNTRAVLFANLGAAQQAMGETDAALQSLQRAVALDENNVNNRYNLGLAYYHLGDLARAEDAFRRVIETDPGNVKGLYNLASLLQDQVGREAEAERLYSKVLQLSPDLGDAHHNLGLLMIRRGAFDQAIQQYQWAVDKGVALSAVFLGDLYQLRRQPMKAQQFYRKAVDLDPTLPDARGKLGTLLFELGDQARGLTQIIKSLELAPDRIELWQTFARTVSRLPGSQEPRYSELLEKALKRRGVDPGFLSKAVTNVLDQRYELNSRYAVSQATYELSHLLEDKALFDDSLLDALLLNTLVTSTGLEFCLSALRRAALLHTEHPLFRDRLALLAALATQCFYNEFVWTQTNEETDTVAALKERVIAALKQGDEISPFDVCILGSYMALSTLPGCEQLNEREWPEPVFVFLHDTLAADLVERDLRSSIPSLTAVNDQTSKQVRMQYEESPYPRWLRVDSKLRGKTNATLRSIFPEIEYICGEPPQVLVAGCGTGRQVCDVAWHYADAEILAVDLSLTSLAYAKRMTGVYGHENVEFQQADLLELDGLARQFDVIECSGVLHHLKEPLRGWKVLADRLRPGGFMRCGLYSERARASVRAARALIDELGLPATLEGIRAGRRAIQRAGADHAAFVLTGWPDFCSASTCRDLIFHVQETSFTPKQIAEALNKLGLEFLGFSLISAGVQNEFAKRFPDDYKMLDLNHWDEIEQDLPNLFIGMYHFWCRKRP